ncbi:MAG: hypothetical protein FJ011_17060 [Chloroflexi bacterium]|nr:hypothetical protein [Chloroflexota bacterium]
MRRFPLLLVWVMTLGMILAACRPVSTSKNQTCDTLLATPLQAHVGQTTTLEEFIDAVEKTYGIPHATISTNSRDSGGWFASWDQDGLKYGVLSRNGRTVDQIGIEYELNGVTVGQFLDCTHSPPEWYWAAYGSNPPITGIRYAFDLYFPAEGLVATGTGSDHRQQTPPPLTNKSVISRVFIGVRDSLPALYQQRWGNALEDVRTSLRPVPWSGSLEAVRFVEDREMGW